MDPGSVSRFDGATVEVLLAERDWLLALARRLLLDDGAAHDLAQDAILSVLEKPPASSTSPRAFLATVVRRAAAKWSRANRRRSTREHRVAETERLPDTAQLAAEAEARRAVVDAVLALEEPYRRTILLRFFRGVASAVIAKEEGVTPAAIDTRVFRALAMLRERLDSSYGSRPTWGVPLLASTRSWTAANSTVAALAGGLSMNIAIKIGIVAAIAVAIIVVHRTEGPKSSAHIEQIDEVVLAPRVESETDRPISAELIVRESLSNSADSPSLAPVARVTVFDAEGVPVSFARLIVETAGELATFRSDESGRCEIVVATKTTVVGVTSTSLAPQRLERTLTTGENRIDLASGAEVCGVVRVNGVAPGVPVRVFFDYTSSEMFEWSRPLRVSTAEGFDFLEITTNEAGEFRFRGLPADVHGDLRPDEHRYRYVDRIEALRVPGPIRGVVLDFAQQPKLIGRVLDSFANALPGAFVEVAYGPDITVPHAVRAAASSDDDGRFELWLALDDQHVAAIPWVARVRVVASDRVREVERSFAIDGLPVVDLGDLVLDDSIATPFRAVDERGHPLSGVVGCGRAGNGVGSLPTDERGEGVLMVGKVVDRVYFAAVGRQVVAVDVERGRAVTVTIPLAASIALSIRRTNGELPKLTWIEIESRVARPFAIPDSGFPIAQWTGLPPSFDEAPCSEVVETDSLWRARYEIQAGEGTIRRLMPGVEFDVRCLDSRAEEIEVRRGIVLSDGETRTVEFTNLPPAAPLALQVRNADRVAVVGAAVYLVDESGQHLASQLSDLAGRLRFEDVEFDCADVVVYAPGYSAGRATCDRIREAAGRPFDVVLELGRRIELRVVDRGGRPVEALTEVSATPPGEKSTSEVESFDRSVSDGRYVFEDLPFRSPIEFRVGLGGRRYSQLHDSPANEATIIVPEHGSLEIRCDFALETDYLPRLRLTAANRSEIVEIEIPEFSNRPGSIFFPSVLTGRYSASVISSRDDDRGADRVLARIDDVFEVHAHRATKLVGRQP